jgi:hypothetical protein
MAFTENERKGFEVECNYIRWKIDEIKKNPALLADYPIEEYPYIWERIKRVTAMTREELMQEIIADYVLLATNPDKESTRKGTWLPANEEELRKDWRGLLVSALDD